MKENGEVADVPCSQSGSQDFELVVENDNSAYLQTSNTEYFGCNIFMIHTNNLSAPVTAGCWDPPVGGITVTNSRTNFKFTIQHVLHWAWDGKWFLFSPSSTGITASFINDQFKKGDKLGLTYAAMPDELDTVALSFVHGTNPEFSQSGNSYYNAKSRLRYGTTSETRDGTVWTTNFVGNLNPTEIYYNRKYLISGSTNDIEATASMYVPETMEAIYQLGELNNIEEPIHLFRVDDTFGPSITRNAICAAVNARHICTGSPTPKEGTRPLYYIKCGADDSYVGDEAYHFIPKSDGGILRPYICKGEEISVRPIYKLLGYFVTGDCTDLNNTEYDGNLCSPQLTGADITMESTTDFLFSKKIMSQKEGERNKQSKYHLFTPLLAGIMFCITLFSRFDWSENRNDYVHIPTHAVET